MTKTFNLTHTHKQKDLFADADIADADIAEADIAYADADGVTIHSKNRSPGSPDYAIFFFGFSALFGDQCQFSAHHR